MSALSKFGTFNDDKKEECTDGLLRWLNRGAGFQLGFKPKLKLAKHDVKLSGKRPNPDAKRSGKRSKLFKCPNKENRTPVAPDATTPVKLTPPKTPNTAPFPGNKRRDKLPKTPLYHVNETEPMRLFH